MSAIVADERGEAQARTISPVLVAMVALSVLGAWSLWQQNSIIVGGLGIAGFAAIAAWVIYGAIAVGIVVILQRFAKRPAGGVLLALAWGGLAATWAATAANGAMSSIFLRTIGSDPNAWLTTPVVEETTKALGIVGLAAIPILRRVRPLDGLFYGVLIGAGFQVVEDAIFTITSILQTGLDDAASAIIGNLILRGLTVGLFTHAVFTGVIGAAVGWAAIAPAGQRLRRAIFAFLAYGLMMVAHGIYNSQDETNAIVLSAALVPFAVLLVLVWRGRREELHHLASVAGSEGGWGVLADDQIASIDSPRPAGGDARRSQDRVRSFAWAADHLGPETPQAKRAAAQVPGPSAAPAEG